MKSKKSFLSPETEEEQKFMQAIQQAERQNSGEIRLQIRNQTEENASTLDTTKKKFSRLGMSETKDHNGILFYISVNQRNFSILRDKEIDKVVTPEF